MRFSTPSRFGNKYTIERAQSVIRNQKEPRWCSSHPTAVWGVRSDGQFYSNCREGFLKHEACEVGE